MQVAENHTQCAEHWNDWSDKSVGRETFFFSHHCFCHVVFWHKKIKLLPSFLSDTTYVWNYTETTTRQMFKNQSCDFPFFIELRGAVALTHSTFALFPLINNFDLARWKTQKSSLSNRCRYAKLYSVLICECPWKFCECPPSSSISPSQSELNLQYIAQLYRISWIIMSTWQKV